MLVFFNDMGYIQKSPAQHATDIQMLEDLPQICPAYFNPFTNCGKENVCMWMGLVSGSNINPSSGNLKCVQRLCKAGR